MIKGSHGGSGADESRCLTRYHFAAATAKIYGLYVPTRRRRVFALASEMSLAPFTGLFSGNKGA